MIGPFEWKVREAESEDDGLELTLSNVTFPLTGKLYRKLVEQVRRAMIDQPLASIEWQMSDEVPVIDVSFENLESVRFRLEPMLAELPGLVETRHARDALVTMLEKTAARLRELGNEHFEQFET